MGRGISWRRGWGLIRGGIDARDGGGWEFSGLDFGSSSDYQPWN